jgi:hypothetical protein
MRHPVRIAAVLFLVAFLGLCVAPAAIHSRSRSRQLQTLADMQSIATAWEARAADVHSYSVATRNRTRITPDDLARTLAPKYIRTLPRTDGWGSEFEFAVTDDGYVIRSLGSDRKRDRIATIANGPTRNSADDIIYSNGSFIRYPEASG